MHAPLCQSAVLPEHPLRRLGRRVVFLDQIHSTNAHLLATPRAWPDGAVVFAEHQTAGRGRLGRRWHAPRGAAVLCSFLLCEPGGSPLLGRATILAATAACEAVEAATTCRPAVRWPNDVMVNGRKLAGVLVESTPLSGSECGQGNGCRAATESNPREGERAIVIGIGINCLQHSGHFPPELAGRATSLEIESPVAIDRANVARHLLERLDVHFAAPPSDQDAWHAALGEWKTRCADIGKRLGLRQNGCTFTGTIIDIVESGDLLVHLDQGGRRYFGAATTTRLE